MLMILKGQIMIKKTLILLFLVLFTGNLNAFANTYKMVFVPASEKGDESDYTTLISITEKKEFIAFIHSRRYLSKLIFYFIKNWFFETYWVRML